jgi:carbonic anhydrase
MNHVITFGKLAILILFLSALSVGQKTEQIVSADSALAELKAGNAHHVAHRYTHPHQTSERQRELASGQHPHTQVLSCSDSRVPPEVVFDQGLGDLFVVRVAGNVASDSELGSLEYGALHLHVPLLVVLGHQHCGAVTAAVEGGEAEGHIGSLVTLIRPAVEATKGMPGDPVDNAVKANVEMTVKKLRSSPIFSELIAGGKLKIVGAVYSLDTGKVTWLEE